MKTYTPPPGDQTNVVEEHKKSVLSVGMTIPLPWILVLVATLLFNAGVIYTKFNDVLVNQRQANEKIVELSTSSTKLDNRVDLISERLSQADGRATAQDGRLQDHESRIRSLEKR